MLRKALYWGGVILISLFILASALLYFLFPKDELVQRFLPELETRLGRPVELGDAGVSLWPPFGVYIEDLKVSNLPPAVTPLLLKVDRARIQLSLWALLRGQWTAHGILLRGVSVSYEVFDDSSTNISDLLAGEAGMAPVWIEDLELMDASIVFIDARDQSRLKLSRLDATLHTNIKEMSGRVEMSLGAASWSVDTTRTKIDNPLALKIRGTYDAETDRLNLRILSGSLLLVPVEGSIDIDSLSYMPYIKSELTLGPVEVSDLQAGLVKYLSDSARNQLDSYECSGELRGHATYAGPAGEWSSGQLLGEVVWLAGRLVWNDQEMLRVASVTIPMDRAGFHVSCENAHLMGGPLELAIVGSWPAASRLEVTLSGQADMERVGELMQTSGITGTMSYQATVRGRHDRPKGWSVRMRAEPNRIRFSVPGRPDVEVSAGRLIYDGTGATVRDLEIRAGSTTVVVEAQIPDLRWASLFQEEMRSPMKADIFLSSRYFNLDQVLPALVTGSDPTPDRGASPARADTDLEIRLDFDTLVMGDIQWQSVTAEMTSEGSRLRIDTLSGRLFDGRASLTGDIDFDDPELPRFDLRLQLDSVAMGELRGRFQSLGEHLEGRGSLKAVIQSGPMPARDILDSLIVTGSAAFFDARLVNLKKAHGILKVLGIDAPDPIAFQSRWNTYQLERGRVKMDRFMFRALDAEWTLNGSIGLDGSLNYGLAVTLSKNLSDRFVLPQSLAPHIPAAWSDLSNPADLLKNDTGSAELFVLVQGSFRRPEIRLDWDRMRASMQARFEARVKETVRDELKDKLKKGLKDLFNSKKP